MAKNTIFVAGTDTDVGKTVIAAGLLQAANDKGLRTVAVKPVAAGCEQTDEGLRNSDALLLQQTASIKLAYEQVNPIALEPAIAPHIAAVQAGRRLDADRMAALCRGVMMQPADFMVIEGAGGWRVPLNSRQTLADLPKQLKVPVVLVVGMKLGCISHTLLTVEAIVKDGLRLAGWVANKVDPDMSCYQENLDTLRGMLSAPLLGEVPNVSDTSPEHVASFLDIGPIVGCS
ncbi:dethiobiotin synthase [Amphritea balenae]|uniref:ATP-dependent dethiobiotin synthetase BioD n=1 Tax=Amphritea balenae TaxID=452629 RepID=A0A3P1SMT8_9GAMM|nr:dethiobiotin synthase [Amphritea balenae]RRC97572.1 dethiobiotin synthase [Amphritea balenae]GGK73995.1 ATP-dependent dethiobiotin synthetase BioD [Amphritea balenae]